MADPHANLGYGQTVSPPNSMNPMYRGRQMFPGSPMTGQQSMPGAPPNSMQPSQPPMTGPNQAPPPNHYGPGMAPPQRFGPGPPMGTGFPPQPNKFQQPPTSMQNSQPMPQMGPRGPMGPPHPMMGGASNQAPPPISGHSPMINSMPPKPGMMPPAPMSMGSSGAVAPPPMVNGVPSSQPNFPQGQQPPRPFLNGPPTSSQNFAGTPPISVNGPPPRQGFPPMCAPPPMMGQRPPTPQLPGQFGPRPGGPPSSMTGINNQPAPFQRPRGPTPLLPGGGPPPMVNNQLGHHPNSGQLSGRHLLELPVPYAGHGQYGHQVNPAGISPGVTPGVTPTNSEPVSQKSSRAPSPTPGYNYDALEGGHQGWAAGDGTPTGMPPMGVAPPTNGVPHSSGMPPYTGMPPMPNTGMPNKPGMPPPPSGMPPGGGMPPSTGVPHQMGTPVSGQGLPPQPNQPGLGTPQMTAPVTAPPTSQDMQRAGGITGRRMYPSMPGLQTQVPPPPQPGSQPGMMNTGSIPGQSPLPPNQTQPNYTTSNGPNSANNVNNLAGSFSRMGMQQQVTTADRPINLMQERRLIPSDGAETMRPNLPHDYKKANVNPDIFRCTLSTLPQSQSLLNKSRLPLGILIHPFKDLSQLPVIQSSVIVRCRSCRTYINPFVTFVDMRRWKCNLCFRVNELPDEFNYDPVSKTYGEPHRRPEIRSATIEFIAPSEYMLRPPQPAVYLYVMDVSFNAISTGYLSIFCQTLLDELERIPGDSRTQIGFITFDSCLHFYNLSDSFAQPQMMVVSDVDDVFLPCPDGLLVNLNESRKLVSTLLEELPTMFENNMDTGNALGAALQAAYKLMGATGGRVSVFQTQLPSVGPGTLKNREDPNERAGKNVQHLGPSTDFYKKMSLDCSAQQIAVDLFLMNGQYADLASITGISKYSGGSIHYFPGLHAVNTPSESDRFEGVLRRYFTRKIGFEAVMRIRCTRGLSIHTFHGNFFVRSTDLLSLPNINPDAGFGMQMSIEDTLENNTACFQAALLYTSSKGERRIRVHTMCLPVTNSLSDVYNGADQLAIVGLLSKMAVDKCISQSLSDARDAMINASIDMLGAYGQTLAQSQRMGQLPVCFTLRLMPLYAIAMLKYLGFRVGSSTRLDDRVYALEQCKTLPLCYLLLELYPALYPVHALDDKVPNPENKEAEATSDRKDQKHNRKIYFIEKETKENALSKGDLQIPQPPLLQLSSAHIDRHGVYLMDTGVHHYLWVGGAISDRFCQEVFDAPNFASIRDGMTELPELDNPTSDRLRTYLTYLNDQRPFPASFQLIRDDSRQRMYFLQHMIEDRTESTMSYYEFLQHLQKEVKS